MDNNTALAFNTICNFIRDLNGSFGGKQKSLMLYGHLIEKTGLIHIDPVKKHVSIFKAFVEDNQEAIEARDRKLFKTGTIAYSEKVGIDIKSIFEICDKEEEKVIWNHLLTISAVLNPVGNAKQILKSLETKKKGGGGEDNFLKNIMEKIGSEVENCGEDANPMQMIGSLMSSGALNDIFQSISSGMSDGNLDMGSMMKSMQSMVNGLTSIVEESKDAASPVVPVPPPPTPEEPAASAAAVEGTLEDGGVDHVVGDV